METPSTTRGFGSGTDHRISIADVIGAYGLHEVRRRIAHLHATGQSYAAHAIEHELDAHSVQHPARRPTSLESSSSH